MLRNLKLSLKNLATLSTPAFEMDMIPAGNASKDNRSRSNCPE
jgi:hypothetical protein